MISDRNTAELCEISYNKRGFQTDNPSNMEFFSQQKWLAELTMPTSIDYASTN